MIAKGTGFFDRMIQWKCGCLDFTVTGGSQDGKKFYARCKKNAEPPMISIIEISGTSKNAERRFFVGSGGDGERKAGSWPELYNPRADCYNKATRKNRIRGGVWARAAGFAASG